MFKAKRNFTSTVLGDVQVGDSFHDDNPHIRHLVSVGLLEEAEEYQTKVVRQRPATPKKPKKSPKRKAVKRDVDDSADD